MIDKDKRVQDLVGIENQILKEEKWAIKVIPISEKVWDDALIWPYNGQWFYTVKSGYQILKWDNLEVKNVGASSSHAIDKKVWNVIWFLKVPSKIRIFLWKIYSNAIAYYFELWKKGQE